MSYNPPGWLTEAVKDFGLQCKAQLQDHTGEPEAAIRPPIEHLLKTIANQLGHSLVPHGEAPVTELGIRPDYAMRVDGAVTGYLEVKKPNANLEPSTFSGHNKLQWEQLKDLPDLIYTNGTDWCLYHDGELTIQARLIGDLRKVGKGLTVADETFERLLYSFLQWAPRPITTVNRLVTSIAPLCRLLRSSVLDQLAAEHKAIESGADEWDQKFTWLAKDWRNLLFPTATDEAFADGYAQTLTFALLLARTENIDLTHATSMAQIAQRLGASQSHSLMSNALQLLTGSATEPLRVTLDLLTRVIGAVDWGPIRDVTNDAYLHLYESFLEVYDRKLREDSGTYFTPHQVAEAMVRLTNDVLSTRLDTSEGFLAPAVTTVDPAMGTGTFLNAIIERTAAQAAEVYGAGTVPQAITDLAKRLIGFELQMGSYTVAEMRIADLLKTYNATPPKGGMRLYVINTLDDPFIEETQIPEILAPIAKSRHRANLVKAKTPVTVVIGNPPYDEHAQGKGGWVENGTPDTIAPLRRFHEEGNGRLEYVLKSFYVYFYAWATWKVFDAHPHHRHGIVAFISTAGYLTGPGFKGMRRYLRTTCSEGWIINVSPEGVRPDVSTRLFPKVQRNLAIGLFVREAETDPATPAVLHYTEVSGRRDAKYAELSEIKIDDSKWRKVRDGWDAPFTPAADTCWDDYPALGDLFPWVIPGIKANRTWVYAPSPDILRKRWADLITEKERDSKSRKLKETDDRNIDSVVLPLPYGNHHTITIAKETGQCPTPHRIAYRSFDRQWIIPDQRVIDRPRRELWAAEKCTGQLFLVEQHVKPISSGPGVVVTTLIPDMDHFKGSEGGRVLPVLYPDCSANVAPGLLERLGHRLETTVTASDLAAYIMAVTAHPAFTFEFTEELVTPGVRVPLTADPGLFVEAATLGRELIWAATYGQAFADPQNARPLGDIAYPTTDERRVRNLTPIGPVMPEDITYDSTTQAVRVGHGTFGPVPEQVWTYNVGGMLVVRHWFSSRKAKPGGRKSSPLDYIHIEEWPIEWVKEFNELLTALRRITDAEALQADLLARIISGPTITMAELIADGVKFPTTPADRRPHYSLENT